MNTHTCLPVISQRAEYRNKDRNRFAFGCAIDCLCKERVLGTFKAEKKAAGFVFSCEAVIRFPVASPLYYISMGNELLSQ